jgi:hypothetical protein
VVVLVVVPIVMVMLGTNVHDAAPFLPTKFNIICSPFLKTKTAKSSSSPMSSQHHPMLLRRYVPSSAHSFLETHHLNTVTQTRAGQHHIILHARDTQGCGNNADCAAFALVFQNRKDSRHHSQRIHLDAAPCCMSHFYQCITIKLLIALRRKQQLAYATRLFASWCFCFFSEMGADCLPHLRIHKKETDPT